MKTPTPPKKPKNILSADLVKELQNRARDLENEVNRLYKKQEIIENRLSRHYDLEEQYADDVRAYEYELKELEKDKPLADFCASTHSFTMYKKALTPCGKIKVIITLKVPATAQRLAPSHCGSNLDTVKIRVSEAEVVSIQHYVQGERRLGKKKYKKAISNYDRSFGYEVGKTVKARFDADRNEDCSSGIHGYRTIEAAINHYL